MSSVYQINKGINQSIQFKGLKAQYIWYLGSGVICLLILFAAMYIIGLPSLICVGIIAILGTALVMKIYAMSNRYGEHGLMKAIAKKGIPKLIKVRSRQAFIQMNVKR